MEKANPLITTALLSSIKKLKPSQLILNESNHPRRLKKKYPLPEYLERHAGLSPVVQIAVCDKGPCVITTDTYSFKLKKGDMFIAVRGKSHHESFFNPVTPYMLSWYMFYFRTLAVHQGVYSENGSFRLINRYSYLQYKGVDRKLDGLIKLLTGQRHADWDRIIKALKDIFSPYLRMRPVSRKDDLNGWQTMLLLEVEQYLNTCLSSPVTLQQVADRFAFSPSYLNTLFKKQYYYSIIAYLNRQRIFKAAEHLVRTAEPITAIARRYGYLDPYYFSRMFKKIIGISPRAYRNRYV